MEKRRRRRRKKNNMQWLIRLLVILLVLAVGVLGAVSIKLARARRTYTALSNAVQEQILETTYPEMKNPEVTDPAEIVENVSPETEAAVTETTVPTVPEETEPQPLPQYVGLYETNSDFFGWLKIEDTKIDYPVMYAPYDLEKYLHTDFNGKDFYGGTPYMDVRCTPESDNYLIYGHNMMDGSMFRGLTKYEKKSYWESHPQIRFDTLYTEGEYEIVAAFYDRVYYTYEDCFKFYNVIDLADETAYNDAIVNFKAKSLYDTGVTPEFGTQLITLVTCAYHTENGRFVVVACEK